MGLKSLSERRHDLCINFASKTLKHDKFSNWFYPTEKATIETQSVKNLLKPVKARTVGY